jgi:hypothetical protein
MKKTFLKNLGRLLSLGTALSLALFGVTSATASTIDDGWSAPTSGITTPWGAGDPVNLGDIFTSTVTATVTKLGIYAGNGSSFAPETVGLYNAAGTLLTFTTVTDNDPIYDDYYWAPTSPAQVVAGQSYTVVDQTGDNAWGYLPPPVDHWATFTGSDYLYTGTLTDPSPASTYYEDAYYGGNAAIPEGGYGLLYLLLAAAVMLSAFRLSKAGMVA